MNEQRYIYAISDGEYLKVGFAKDIGGRVGNLQTSNARELTVLRRVTVPQWKKSTSRLVDAKNHEAKLHKLMHAFAIRGEWFSMSALEVFDRYWKQQNTEQYRCECGNGWSCWWSAAISAGDRKDMCERCQKTCLPNARGEQCDHAAVKMHLDGGVLCRECLVWLA